jgi:predicted HTH transcriptional regulator
MNNHHNQILSKIRTKLTEDDLTRVQRVVFAHLKTHESITNRVLREITSVTYDQAIFFFGQMLKRKALKKIGTSSATRYILRTKKAN